MLDFGLSKQDFFEQYHERQPFIKRGGYHSRHIGWAEVDQAIYAGEATESSRMRVHKDGFVEEHRYTEICAELGLVRQRIIKPALTELLEAGASIIYNRMESVSVPVRQLCNTVARYTGATSVANGYISFGDQETFGNHWDTHDVFAVQLIGRKRWLVYEPTYPLPLPGQTSLHHKHDCPETPVIDEILEAGDIMYIPRGWWHTAVPLREETFHVAIGTHPHSMHDYLSWVMKNKLPQHLSYRQSLRMDPSAFAKVAAASAAINAELFSEENFTAFQESLLESERIASRFDVAREFRPDLGRNIEAAHYALNSKSSAAYVDAAKRINGAPVCSHADSAAVMRTLARAERALGFQAVRALHPDIGRVEMRLILGDLLARDVVEAHPPATGAAQHA